LQIRTEKPDRVRATSQHQIRLGGRQIDYRVIHSPGAQRLRVRVGPNGVDVVKPKARSIDEIIPFLDRNADWLMRQIELAEKLASVRRREQLRVGEILYRGEPTTIRIETAAKPASRCTVHFIEGSIVIRRGRTWPTQVARTLELWLRRQARNEIERQLSAVTARLREKPHRIYIMGQRTKWGNCSSKRNLSFNWRLILAPDFVLRYLITHEAVHLAIPDHSAKFWLTVQSLCRETERAKQWLSANGQRLSIDVAQVSGTAVGGDPTDAAGV
jgi:predicted metal-dependent hydrolase